MNEDNDDLPIGKILTRREVLALFGLAGSQLLTACAPLQMRELPFNSAPGGNSASHTTAKELTGVNSSIANSIAVPSCIVSPALTEGPYFVDEKLNRADIRTDTSDGSVKSGTPFKLNVRVLQANTGGCSALTGAVVDIWHCDAVGVYSDAIDRGFNTKGKNFLRGYQITNANGVATFQTIYPGWYSGRAVHIHFKIRATTSAGKSSEFTSQFFFDPALSEKVFASAPYNSKGAKPDTPNNQDAIYRESKGQTLLTCTPDSAGYTATFDIGITL